MKNYAFRVLSVLILTGFFLAIGLDAQAQRAKVTGKIVDELTGEPLIGASVVLKGTTTGTATNIDGVFELEVDDAEQVIVTATYLGYTDRDITFNKPFEFTEIRLKDFVIAGEEVVVTASRVSESVMESSMSIDKMDSREIRTAASGNFYADLGNFQDVDIVQTSAGFYVVNMRGFNTSQPERSVQFIDGIDNQAPGLNFAVGNLMGANDLELQNVEIIHGAASALYGANALQGVVNMTTKDPYNFPGLALQVKGGSRDYFDVQGRYARTFGKDNRWAFKISGSYMQIQDWEADDPEANLYGDIDPDVDMSAIIRQLQFKDTSADFTLQDLRDGIKLNAWLDFNPAANPGTRTIQAPGYMERDVADYDSKAWKVSPSLHYKFKRDNEVSYLFKLGSGTAVYQGTNRYSIKDIRFQQHKLEFTGKNYFARAYTTMEDAGDSYDNVFTAINISKFGISEYVSEYISAYFDVIDTLTAIKRESFCADCLDSWMVDSAHVAAAIAAQNQWVQPGTHVFDSLFNEIVNDPDLQTGSKFLDQSKMVHVEGQYRFTEHIKWLDLIAGASYRIFLPRSFGTIFSDTLVNPGDTLSNGRNDPDADYVKLRTQELGIYGQATKKFFEDRLKLIFSLRMDKQIYDNNRRTDNTYNNLQFSPRGSVVFSQGNHNLRVSGQSAFRNPTLQDQSILLDLGPITLVGNLNGFENLYTFSSVDTFHERWDRDYTVIGEVSEILDTIKIDPIRPEQVRSIELGYRTVHNKVFYIDFSFYYNWYKDFIGDIRVAQPDGGARAGEQSGEDAIITGNYNLLQVPVNSKQIVRTYGFSVGLSYYFGKGISLKGNYTFSDINEEDLTDDLIPGFNTPKHKFNLGLEGKRIWKGLGFNSNFRWSDTYLWQAPFGDGQIPAFFTLDGQLNYELKDYHLTLAVGGSNLLDREYRTAYGSPLIGRMFYGTIIFDINRW